MMFVTTFQFLNQWTDLHEIWHERYADRGYPECAMFNSLLLAIIWRTHEPVMWKRHQPHLI
jgi:hypothetical protein